MHHESWRKCRISLNFAWIEKCQKKRWHYFSILRGEQSYPLCQIWAALYSVYSICWRLFCLHGIEYWLKINHYPSNVLYTWTIWDQLAVLKMNFGLSINKKKRESFKNTLYVFTFPTIAFIFRNWYLGSFFCLVTNFMSYYTVATSVFSLMAITAERWVSLDNLCGFTCLQVPAGDEATQWPSQSVICSAGSCLHPPAIPSMLHSYLGLLNHKYIEVWVLQPYQDS